MCKGRTKKVEPIVVVWQPLNIFFGVIFFRLIMEAILIPHVSQTLRFHDYFVQSS